MVKPESLQVTGSFKARGAFNAVLSLLEREPDVAGVVTHSSGNHGQALACAARAAGLRATIVVPEGVTPAKIAGIRSFGATVVTDGVTYDNREEIAEEHRENRGLAADPPVRRLGRDSRRRHRRARDPRGRAGTRSRRGADRRRAVRSPGSRSRSPRCRRRRRSSVSSPRLPMTRPGACDAGTLQTLASDPATLAEGVKSKSIGRPEFRGDRRRRAGARHRHGVRGRAR